MIFIEKKKFKLGDIKESSLYKNIGKNFTITMLSMLLIIISLILIQSFFYFSSLILNFSVILITFIAFFIFKDGASERVKLSLILKTLMFFSTILFVNTLIFKMSSSLKGNELYKACILMTYVLDFIILIISIAALNNQGFTETVDNMCEESLMNKLCDKEEEIKLGDAVIGYEKINGKKSKKPVVLPLKDRFLHMLILGPTGSGKTSQSIIPMINRDMSKLDMGITVLEPKGDLAEKVYAMAKYYNREVVYFNPILPDCPTFNPLYGAENDVVENMATTFNMLNPDAPQFFKDMSENLIRKSVILLKRLYGNDATLLDLNALVWNASGEGKKMLSEFNKLKVSNSAMERENAEIVSWFANDYYSGMDGSKGSKTFEHCSGVRSQIAKLTSNKYLRKVLNPERGRGSDLDFDDAFERGVVVTMSTAQGSLRDLGRYLGYFIILQLQASVFRRPGNEDTRTHNMLYIDEFQVYSNPGFADMLTMGRSYRVASHLATQARTQMAMGGGKDGQNFVELVSTNARNKIIYPGVSIADAKYYSDEFGEIAEIKESKTYAKKRFLSTLSDERVSTAIKEELKARFSPTDIIYKSFGEITYCIIKNNSVQTPGESYIEYIPKELNSIINKMVEEYNEEQFKKAENPEELRDMISENLDENNKFNQFDDLVNYETKETTVPLINENVEILNEDIFENNLDMPEDNLKAKTINSKIIGEDILESGDISGQIEEVEDNLM